MAEKKKMSFNDLLMNNKFVFVISLLFSVVLWAMVSMTIGDNETRVIENVKVMIDDSETSLYKIFGYEETYVDVTVKGKKYLISSAALSASDITVTAKNIYVDSAGMQKLKLTASVDKMADIKITNISRSNIEVFFDIPKTATFPVETVIRSDGDMVPEGYIYEDPILPISTVTVTGPATEINKIEKFKATAKINEPLTSTTEINVTLTPVVTGDKKIKYINYETDIENLSVTIPVAKVKEIPLSVRYVDMPPYYESNMPEVNIFPKTLKVAAAESVLDSLETLNVGTIDFSQLENKNNHFTFKLEDIKEVIIIDDIKTAKVSVNCYPMRKKEFNVSRDNIMLLNVPGGMKAEIVTSEIKNVTVYGMKDELEYITEDRLSAKVDLSNASEGTKSYKAVVYVRDAEKSWVYGTYKVKIRID